MIRHSGRALVGLLLVSCAGEMAENGTPVSGTAEAAAPVVPAKVYTREIISSEYHIDGLYPSMTGPSGFDHVTLGNAKDPELLWIVGYKTLVVDSKSQKAMSQEYMCHANLDFDPTEYYGMFPTQVPLSGRVFTLSQGQQDIKFPEGFGIPIGSHLPLSLATQVLNLNEADIDLKVRHKVEILYVKDSELKTPMKPLFQGAVEGFKALGDAKYYGIAMAETDPEDHGEGCSVGQAAIAGDSDDDSLGQKFTAHWVVPPGRELNRTNVTRFLNLPFDTTAHYIAVHLHPFAESLELIDITDKKTLYKAYAKNTADKIGLEEIQYYSSPEGIAFKKGHEYELVSVYNNTSDKPADSMAVMYLYLLDKEFKKPEFAKKVPKPDAKDPS